jgi:hypothetical protein
MENSENVSAAAVKIAGSGATRKTCFVISQIGEPGSSERRDADYFLQGIVREALKDLVEINDPLRADEATSPGMISSSIINSIINCDIVIADLTGLNPNVFYELGIRHSIQKPTIHTAKLGTILPFDNKDHNTIFYEIGDWTSQQDAIRKIKKQFESISKKDYKLSNPVTFAVGLHSLKVSGDPEQGILAEIATRVARLEENQTITATENWEKNSKITKDKISRQALTFENQSAHLRLIAEEIVEKFGRNDLRYVINDFVNQNRQEQKYRQIVQMLEKDNITGIIDKLDEIVPF